jgi:NADP-dependent 3-hydroxy acid dehydrogenase YdfG
LHLVAARVYSRERTAVSTYGPVEVLVNNAGVYQFEPVEALKEEDYDYH